MSYQSTTSTSYNANANPNANMNAGAVPGQPQNPALRNEKEPSRLHAMGEKIGAGLQVRNKFVI